MKKYFSFLFLIFLFLLSKAQSDTIPEIKNISLDILKTPSNPAFIIMSTSPVEISEPTTPTEFYISIQNASNNFTSLPNNYGFTVAPFWWTKSGKELNFDKDFSTRNKIYFWRYLRLSVGMVKGVDDNEDLWRYGFGFQTNIFSGKVEKKKKERYLNALRSYHNNYYQLRMDFYKKYPLYSKIENEVNGILERLKAANNSDSLLAEELSRTLKLKQQLEELLLKQFELEKGMAEDSLNVNTMFSDLEKRIGFKWDIGAGISNSIENRWIDSSDVNRFGVWTNFGWVIPVSKSGAYLSILGLTRILAYEDAVYQYNDTSFYKEYLGVYDFGAQVKFEFNSKFSFLVEGVYRMYSDERTVSTFKVNSMAQYKFNPNQIVFVSFGNEFNNNNDQGPQRIQLNIGVSLGIGNNIGVNFH